MQIILSPAKLMDFNNPEEPVKLTKPMFADKTEQLVDVCKRLSVNDIAQKMVLKKEMAQNVFGYFQSFDFKNTPQRSAAFAYNGIAYKGLNIHDFSPEELKFAQARLNIISGLYGILRPLDAIQPYRLEMQRNIVPKGFKNLYEFWQNTLTNYLSEKLANDDNVLISVASKEYSKAILKNKLPKGVKFIETNFLQLEGGDLKQIVVHTKKARGLLARFIFKNHLVSHEEVKSFDYEGYSFYPVLSKENYFVFVR